MGARVKGVKIADFRPLEETLDLEIYFSKIFKGIQSRLKIKNPDNMLEDFLMFLNNLQEDDKKINLENINEKKIVRLFENVNRHALRLKSYKTIKKYLKEYNKLRFRKIRF